MVCSTAWILLGFVLLSEPCMLRSLGEGFGAGQGGGSQVISFLRTKRELEKGLLAVIRRASPEKGWDVQGDLRGLLVC